MVFSKKFLYLDQTRFRYQISVTTGDGVVNITVTQLSYLYSEEWEENKPTGKGGEIYRAEEWITDEHALNKKGTKVLPQSGKFRRKTIDRIEEIFENAMDMFETKVKEEKAKENKEEKVQKRQFVVE
jgi:colicin import membrane protein